MENVKKENKFKTLIRKHNRIFVIGLMTVGAGLLAGGMYVEGYSRGRLAGYDKGYADGARVEADIEWTKF